MTNRFDLVFSLGSACSCTQALRAAGLQFASFPLDWVSGSDMQKRAELVSGGFGEWLRIDDFERVENPGAFGHDTYRNRRTDLTHPHDFDKGVPLDASFAAVKAKYDRRIARLNGLLAGARRVLAVWIADPRDTAVPDDETVRASLARFSAAWPKAAFHMLVLDCAQGVLPEARRVTHAAGYDRISFDYACHAPGAKPWSVEPDLLQAVLSGYACVDYRTDEERRAERMRERVRKWRRYGAASAMGCFVNGLEYRLWHHLLRKLKKAGVCHDGVAGGSGL